MTICCGCTNRNRLRKDLGSFKGDVQQKVKEHETLSCGTEEDRHNITLLEEKVR